MAARRVTRDAHQQPEDSGSDDVPTFHHEYRAFQRDPLGYQRSIALDHNARSSPGLRIQHPLPSTFTRNSLTAFLIQAKTDRVSKLNDPRQAALADTVRGLRRQINSGKKISVAVKNGELVIKGAKRISQSRRQARVAGDVAMVTVSATGPDRRSSRKGITSAWKKTDRKSKLVPDEQTSEDDEQSQEQSDSSDHSTIRPLAPVSAHALADEPVSRRSSFEEKLELLKDMKSSSETNVPDWIEQQRAWSEREAQDQAYTNTTSDSIGDMWIPLPGHEPRSLSFQKHADEQRQIGRSEKQKKPHRHDAEDAVVSASPSDEGSPRPRKIVAKASISDLASGLHHHPAGSTDTSSNHFESGAGLPSELPNSHNPIAAVVSMWDTPSSVADDNNPEIVSARVRRDADHADHADSILPNGDCRKTVRLCTVAGIHIPRSACSGLCDEYGVSDEMSQDLQDTCDRDDALVITDTKLAVFNHSSIVPERVPFDIVTSGDNVRRVFKEVGLDEQGKLNIRQPHLYKATQYSLQQLDPDLDNILGTQDSAGKFPRDLDDDMSLSTNPRDPPQRSSFEQQANFPYEVWLPVVKYLSHEEICRLRFVNKATAHALAPLLVRNTVTNFGRSMFDLSDSWDGKATTPLQNSMLERYGPEINKFGISFEYSLPGLCNVKPKVIEKEVRAWFGKYTWPVSKYPRYESLKVLEDLVDDNIPLLKNAMKNLTGVSELALSVDSGHGWLTGPDMSDMAIFKERDFGGIKVFGRQFDAEDSLNEDSLRKFFRWAQFNSVNEILKQSYPRKDKNTGIIKPSNMPHGSVSLAKNVQIRDYDSYKIATQQRDFERHAHTGGCSAEDDDPGLDPPPQLSPPDPTQIVLTAFSAGLMDLWDTTTPDTTSPTTMPTEGQTPISEGADEPVTEKPRLVIPQWPLIFNGINIASELFGHRFFMQRKVAPPLNYPIYPRYLTEAQVQWLMETVWAQRAFLSAYTNSVIVNAHILKGVHSLHIAKISSGLLPALAQKEFWTSLKGLKNLTLLVSPDWRQEHVPGDKLFARNMSIPPLRAATELTELLRGFICGLENLSVLKVGYVGGGEHAAGIFARGKHILPAPVVEHPDLWLSEGPATPDRSTMLTFDHIRELAFENCWFSPRMLEVFMRQSRDTSLHHLILDSVSMTGAHNAQVDAHAQTINRELKCEHSPGEWLREAIPSCACWVKVLDKITPGKTLFQRKLDVGLVNVEEEEWQPRKFRGNVEKITLKSCGYVTISGVRSSEFNQHSVIWQSRLRSAMDQGLVVRRSLFFVDDLENIHMKDRDMLTSLGFSKSSRRRRFYDPEIINHDSKDCIMMSTTDPVTHAAYFGLGTMTQCVHPIEKRILEQAWKLQFGWGDNIERYYHVEDGLFEGGTGRFSGVVDNTDYEDTCESPRVRPQVDDPDTIPHGFY